MAMFSQEEADNLLDGRKNSFRQGIQDSTYTAGSPFAMAAGTEYLLTNDALSINDTTSPGYITSRWDATNSKIAMPEEYDHPTYVNDFQFLFDPDTAAAGTVTFRVYIDESGTRDFTSDPEIRNYTADYKAVADKVSDLATWYFGDSAGYDAKNNGVYFTVEASGAGDLYGTFFSIYRT